MKKENSPITKITQQLIEPLKMWADDYHDNKNSRAVIRTAIVGSLLCQILSLLLLENNPQYVIDIGLIGCFFGIPLVINFIREKKGYYQDQNPQNSSKGY